jgi:hypothetical protein
LNIASLSAIEAFQFQDNAKHLWPPAHDEQVDAVYEHRHGSLSASSTGRYFARTSTIMPWSFCDTQPELLKTDMPVYSSGTNRCKISVNAAAICSAWFGS